ncbi:hypothetical protein M2266_001812 [Streptomyces sp. SPB162]|nr:hypothetical protein [Streptomyces sp. SPB162]
MTTDTIPRQQGIIPLPEKTARALVAIGAAATAVSTFLPWTWTSEYPGDLTVAGYPGGLQVLALVGALLTLLYAAASYGVRGLRWLNPAGTDSPLFLLTRGLFGVVGYTVVSITVELNGIVNLEPGAYVAIAAALATLIGALALPSRGAAPVNVWKAVWGALDTDPPPKPARTLPSWAELLVIVAAFGVGLYVFTYGIDTAYAELFVGFLIVVAFSFAALIKSGLIARLTILTTKHRNVTIAAAFTAAAAFPFTQDNDAYTSVGVNILVFATVALGLNVVVGLAGPPRPRIRRLPRRRRLHRRPGIRLHLLRARHPVPLLGRSPRGRRRLPGLRRPHRSTHPAAARRLPRHRHPRLR